jgi:hypothetical protein
MVLLVRAVTRAVGQPSQRAARPCGRPLIMLLLLLLLLLGVVPLPRGAQRKA